MRKLDFFPETRLISSKTPFSCNFVPVLATKNWFLLCFEDDDLHEILNNDDEIESLILEVVDKVLEYQSKFATSWKICLLLLQAFIIRIIV